MRLPCSILATALVCGAVSVSSVSATPPEGASFALKPVLYDPALTATKSYFILAVKPGATVKDKVRIVNTGGQTGTAFIYPVDATTGQTSGAVYLSRQAPRRDVGAWMTVATPKVTLAPGKDAVVAFTVHVPRSARPGDHLGALVAENAQVQSSSGKSALQIRIKHLTIAAVELQLPGPVTGRVVATGVKAGGEHGYQYVYIHLKSTGNVLVKPAATLTVRNAAGRVVTKLSIQLDTFVPGTEIDYPALLPKQALKPGNYTAEVRLRSSNDRVLGYRKTDAAPFDDTQTFPFTVTATEQTKVFSGVAPVQPPEEAASKPSSSKRNYVQIGVVAALAGLLIGMLYLLFVRLRRGRKRRRGEAPPNAPKPAAPSGGPAAAPPPEEDEVPGWAGLLAAYETKPRLQSNGSAAEHAAAPAPVAAVAVAALDPASEPTPHPALFAAAEPDVEPTVEHLEEPGNALLQETTWPVPASSGPAVEPALVVAAHRVLEPVVEPEPFVEAAPVVEPADAFELHPEPWFEPEPQVEVSADAEDEPALEFRSEPWFEPQAEVEPIAAFEFDPQPGVDLASGNGHAADASHVLDQEQLKELIVEDDEAVADAYLRSRPPEPAPAPAPLPVRSDVRALAEANNISAALVEASLIALAALLATRLLKSPD